MPAELIPVPISEQLAAAQRELKYRDRVYARRVTQGHMTQVQADYQLRCMASIVATLERLSGEARLL